VIGGAWPFLVREVICLLNCVSLKKVYFMSELLFFVHYLTNNFLLTDSFGFSVIKIVSLINKKKSFYEIITFEGNERDRSPLLPYFNLKAFFLFPLENSVSLRVSRILQRVFGD